MKNLRALVFNAGLLVIATQFACKPTSDSEASATSVSCDYNGKKGKTKAECDALKNQQKNTINQAQSSGKSSCNVSGTSINNLDAKTCASLGGNFNQSSGGGTGTVQKAPTNQKSSGNTGTKAPVVGKVSASGSGNQNTHHCQSNFNGVVKTGTTKAECDKINGSAFNTDDFFKSYF